MSDWMRFLRKLNNLLRPHAAERDMAREINSHLQLLQDDFQGRGMSPDEARLAAKRAYGGIEQAKELHREERSWHWLEQVQQDVRFSIRALRNSPGFSIVAVLMLALGIGANTAIFSLLDALMLRSLPVRHPEQLAQVNMIHPDIWDVENPFVSNPIWERLRDRQDVFSGIFGYAAWRFNLSIGGEARYVQGNYVSGDFFETLGLRPIAGRVIGQEDDRRGCSGTAVLGYSFWQSEYGGRAEIVGKTISLDNHPFEVLGVIGPGFSGVDVGRQSSIYVPICAETIIGGANGLLDGRRGGWLRVIGRPKPDLSMNQVAARLRVLGGPILEETIPPEIRPSQKALYLKRSFAVQAAANGLSSIRSKYRLGLIVLMAIAGTVLLLVCSNVANLLLARGTARQREIAIRMALGSGRFRLIRQFLIESLLLSMTGATLGIVFAHWGAQLLVRLLTSNVYRESQVFLDLRIDSHMLVFTVGAAVLTGLLFGLAPAWFATGVEPQSAMKANARGLPRPGKFMLGKGLVVTQVALSLTLVASTGLLLLTFIRLKTLDPGFERADILLTDVDLSQNIEPERRSAVFGSMLDGLRVLPGIRSASISTETPLGGAVGAFYIRQIDSYTSKEQGHELVFLNTVSDGYFQTLGMHFLAGRDFNQHDSVTSPKVAVVSESFAKKYLNGRNPTGLHYRPEEGGKPGDPVEIIGMVRDVKSMDLRENFHPTVYVTMRQNAKWGRSVTFEVRTAAGTAASMMEKVKHTMSSVEPDASLEFRTLANQVDKSLARERLLASLSAFFGGTALLLAMLGLYGVVSYDVARRRNEIGIRMALGAQQARVLRTIVGEVAVLVAIGLFIGLAAALGATRLIATFLYGVKANDPRMLSLAAAALAIAAVLAGFFPAYRASRLNPLEALREE